MKERDGGSGRIIKLLPGVPRKGWVYEYCTDLEVAEGECMACGYPEVRYMHTLSHPGAADPLDVGCVCSGHLTADYETPRTNERRLKGLDARAARFVRREWGLSDRGVYWMRYKGFLVWVIRRPDDLWVYGIDTHVQPDRFQTFGAAAKAAYKRMFGPQPTKVRAKMIVQAAAKPSFDTAESVFDALPVAGITLALKPDWSGFTAMPRSALTPELTEALRAHKPAILDRLVDQVCAPAFAEVATGHDICRECGQRGSARYAGGVWLCATHSGAA